MGDSVKYLLVKGMALDATVGSIQRLLDGVTNDERISMRGEWYLGKDVLNVARWSERYNAGNDIINRPVAKTSLY